MKSVWQTSLLIFLLALNAFSQKRDLVKDLKLTKGQEVKKLLSGGAGNGGDGPEAEFRERLIFIGDFIEAKRKRLSTEFDLKRFKRVAKIVPIMFVNKKTFDSYVPLYKEQGLKTMKTVEDPDSPVEFKIVVWDRRYHLGLNNKIELDIFKLIFHEGLWSIDEDDRNYRLSRNLNATTKDFEQWQKTPALAYKFFDQVIYVNSLVTGGFVKSNFSLKYTEELKRQQTLEAYKLFKKHNADWKQSLKDGIANEFNNYGAVTVIDQIFDSARPQVNYYASYHYRVLINEKGRHYSHRTGVGYRVEIQSQAKVYLNVPDGKRVVRETSNMWESPIRGEQFKYTDNPNYKFSQDQAISAIEKAEQSWREKCVAWKKQVVEFYQAYGSELVYADCGKIEDMNLKATDKVGMSIPTYSIHIGGTSSYSTYHQRAATKKAVKYTSKPTVYVLVDETELEKFEK